MLFKYVSCTDLFVHILSMNCPYSLCFQLLQIYIYWINRDHFVFPVVFKLKSVFFRPKKSLLWTYYVHCTRITSCFQSFLNSGAFFLRRFNVYSISGYRDSLFHTLKRFLRHCQEPRIYCISRPFRIFSRF